MSIEQMLKERDDNNIKLAKNIEMFRFLTEEPGAEVSIDIHAKAPTHWTDDGEILHSELRNCSLKISQHRDKEDIEAMKQILCRNVSFIKKNNSELTSEMISMLQEEADQGSGDK